MATNQPPASHLVALHTRAVANFPAKATRFTYTKPTTRQKLDIIRAIWFWGIEKWHNSMAIRDSVRCNVILMLLLLSQTELQEYCREGAISFMQAFIAAWLEGMH
jgi:hypothetical protein